MSEPFLGEIRVVAFDYAPRGWAVCAGQILSIAQNTALFSLLGTTYGGNGQTTFALPDFRGRVGISSGQGPGLPDYVLGEQAGEEKHLLSQAEMASHNHRVAATGANATTNDPRAGVFAKPFISQRFQNLYQASSDTSGGLVVGTQGGGQPHENRQPFLCALVVIALQGVFPPRN